VDGGKQCVHRSVVAEGAADVDVPVLVAWTEYETAAELKRVLAEFVLPVAGRAGVFAGGIVIRSQHVQQVCLTQAGRMVSLALLVDQQREPDSGLFLEEACVVAVAQADSRQIGAEIVKFVFVFAQLRDVLAAEYSTVMPEKNDHCRLPFPK